MASCALGRPALGDLAVGCLSKVYTHTHTHTHTHANICRNTNTHTHKYMYTNIHLHTNMKTQSHLHALRTYLPKLCLPKNRANRPTETKSQLKVQFTACVRLHWVCSACVASPWQVLPAPPAPPRAHQRRARPQEPLWQAHGATAQHMCVYVFEIPF